jgi:hypothetical protein
LLGAFCAAAAAIASASGTQSLGVPLGADLRCLGRGLLAGALPVLGLAAVLRRGASLRPQRCALLAGLAGAALGALCTRLACPADAARHTLLGHPRSRLSRRDPGAPPGALAGRLEAVRLRSWGTRACPLGLQLVSSFRRDETLLAAAAGCEAISADWSNGRFPFEP